MIPSSYHPERTCVKCKHLVYREPHICKPKRKPIKRSGSPIKRSGRPRKSNPKRRRSEFARCYHSKERVEFVKSLPCAACGVQGYSENAHVLGNGGMSRKADYTTIAPLCGVHTMWAASGEGSPQPITLIGCHAQFDQMGSSFYSSFPSFEPENAAEETEKLWLSRTLEDQ